MPITEEIIRYYPFGSSHAWRPGVFRQIPVLGIFQLVGVVIATCAAITILVVSDGASISDWKYSPAVYLTISYTISNILLAAAFSQGVTLSWWNKAIREGTVLGDLHRYHAQGTGAWEAITSGKHFSFIAFATILVTLTPINGPLLQRSSTIGSRSLHSQANLAVPIARALWDGTGFVSTRSFDVALFSQPFNDIVQAYYRADAIAANSTGCPGDATCTGRLAGAGLTVNCSTSSGSYDLNTNVLDADGNSITNINGTYVFMSSFLWSSEAPGNISLSVQFKDTPAIEGNLVVKNCSLQTATVQYPVVIDGNTSTISLAADSSIFDDMLVSTNPYELETSFGQSTTIGGYAFALTTRFSAWITVNFAGAAGYDIRTQGSVGPQFASMDDIEEDFSGEAYRVKFNDPTSYLLHQARELMFRTALAQGNSSTSERVQDAAQVRNASVYVSHYDFLGIAVAISTISFGVVLASFHGYWHLGREVTMSPIEIAKAFNAPLLADEDSNASAQEIVKSAGTKPAQYGRISEETLAVGGKYRGSVEVMSSEHSGSIFRIADPAQVKSLRR
ncbi:hypothetical protein BST61_g10392 [Cercospora zeina]